MANSRVFSDLKENGNPSCGMSSEIEMVAEVQSNCRENSKSSFKPIENESLKNDVYTAAAYGDLEKLHILVECEGRSVSEPDGLGYYALQWSALNNRTRRCSIHFRGTEEKKIIDEAREINYQTFKSHKMDEEEGD